MICIVAGNLVVNVLARTRGFTQNIGKARAGLKGFRRDVLGANKTLSQLTGLGARLTGGLAAVFSGAAATTFIRNQLESIDALGKVSTRLGIATEELQFYQFAARQSGVETRTLNMAIQRMTRRIGEFAIGTGEARDTLEGLGFDAERLVRMRPEEQFELMLETLRGIGDENERLRVAFKLFDSEGVAVLQMVNNIRQARNEFRELGLAINETDVRRIEEVTDQMGKLGAAAARLGQEFIVDASPEALIWMDGAVSLMEEQRRTAAQRQRSSTTRERMARRAGVRADDPALSGVAQFGDVFAGFAVTRSLEQTRQLELQRQAAIAANPRQIQAGAQTTSDNMLQTLQDIEMNTRKPRDGT